jgi:hypothetical protein
MLSPDTQKIKEAENALLSLKKNNFLQTFESLA